MKRRFNLIIVSIALIITSLNLFIFSKTNDESDEVRNTKIQNEYRIYSLNIPDSFNFCNELVPLHNQDIKERFDKELLVNTYYQSQTLLYCKRIARWFPVIEPILKEAGIPEDFKFLCVIESGLTNAVSPAGAKGFWQFMNSTGKEYGLEINSEVDERYHVEKSTLAATKYLKDAYDKFGSWTLAAASYNMGMVGLERAMKRQKVNNYYDLLLNTETSRYVFRILAVKEILENQEKYGFHVREKDKYPPLKFKTENLSTSVQDFADYANKRKINYKILKLFNPWLRESYLKNSDGNTYSIKIPTEGYIPIDLLNSIESDSISEIINESSEIEE